LPGIRRGLLEENQSIEWDENDRGLTLRSRFILPFSVNDRLPSVALQQLGALNDALSAIERRIAS
jgi:hypothetical protein